MTEDPTPFPSPESAPAPRPSQAERRQQAALDVLRTLCRDIFLDRVGPRVEAPDRIPITLRVVARPGEVWELEADPPLMEQIEAHFEEVEARRDAYREGHVYCFRCGSAACPHAAPPGPLEVFKGYSPQGVPEWCELGQYLIETRDEAVDQLYARPPRPVVRSRPGRDLRLQQLSSYGKSSKTYAILGQVVAGYYRTPIEVREGTGIDRVALTVQAVETRGPQGPAVRLNLLSGLPGDASWSDLAGMGWAPWIRRAYLVTRKELERIGARVSEAYAGERPAEARKAMQEVPGVLARLARSLERGGDQSRRRTAHAEQRRDDRRPVHKAMEDLRTAGLDRFFLDEKANTFVVCGPQGRTHAFSADGKHVTSFSLRPGTAEMRVRTRRWSAVEPEEAATLREKWLAGRTGEASGEEE